MKKRPGAAFAANRGAVVDRQADSGVSTTFPIVIATVAKGDGEVRISLDEFKGNLTVDIRLFEAFSAAQVAMPTRKGVTLGLSKLPEMAAALVEAERRARALGLLDG